MWSVGPSVAIHLALWYVELVCIQYDVCKYYVCSVSVGWYGDLSESGICVFRELRPVGFLLFAFVVVMLYVNSGDDG